MINIKINKLDNLTAVQDLLNDPRIVEKFGKVIDASKLKSTTMYFGIWDQRSLIGFFAFDTLSDLVVSGHIVLDPEYWGTNVTSKAIRDIKKILITEYKFTKIIALVPLDCEHIHRMLNKNEFKVCGKITNGITFKNEVMDIIIYESN